jgi:hypothetical protein
MPDRGAFGVVAALRPTRRSHVLLHDHGHHLQPGAHARANSPSRSSPASSANATLTVSGTAGALVSNPFFWYLFCTAVPFLMGVLGGSPEYLPHGRTQAEDRRRQLLIDLSVHPRDRVLCVTKLPKVHN